MFYLLTDSMNAGDIIREETGKHYIYSYTRNTWERTGIFYDYFKRESPLYRQYHTISEAEAAAHMSCGVLNTIIFWLSVKRRCFKPALAAGGMDGLSSKKSSRSSGFALKSKQRLWQHTTSSMRHRRR